MVDMKSLYIKKKYIKHFFKKMVPLQGPLEPETKKILQ